MRVNKFNLQSYDAYEKIISEGNIKEMEDLLKSINLASPEFYKFVNQDTVFNQATQKTLWKYYLRSISRSTPFGDFSSILYTDTKCEKSLNMLLDIDSEWFSILCEKYFKLSQG